MLGRPTASSVTINVVSPCEADISVEYWQSESPGASHGTTAPRRVPEGAPVDIEITGLASDTAYSCRLLSRRADDTAVCAPVEGRFHTQRSRGTAFVFTIQADLHLDARVAEAREGRVASYHRMLRNVLSDDPDFHIDMGDFARVEVRGGHSAASREAAAERYLDQRSFLGAISPAVPFYLVLGNHEGEQGWRRPSEGDSLAVWATLARKSLIPNPHPDGFYSGNAESTACCGLREDYYAWEWGDALFVVLDPFGYTTVRPHGVTGGSRPSLDGWDWTLGQEQYDWLYATLHESAAQWKFVFAHHMTGGVRGSRPGEGYYGRGGIDAARYRVAGRPTFEWGGGRLDRQPGLWRQASRLAPWPSAPDDGGRRRGYLLPGSRPRLRV